ncbi:MAG: hypothetical protein ABIU05_16985 [Nitrospirales bacterium]
MILTTLSFCGLTVSPVLITQALTGWTKTARYIQRVIPTVLVGTGMGKSVTDRGIIFEMLRPVLSREFLLMCVEGVE